MHIRCVLRAFVCESEQRRSPAIFGSSPARQTWNHRHALVVGLGVLQLLALCDVACELIHVPEEEKKSRTHTLYFSLFLSQ
jgi:hypothetical protein